MYNLCVSVCRSKCPINYFDRTTPPASSPHRKNPSVVSHKLEYSLAPSPKPVGSLAHTSCSSRLFHIHRVHLCSSHTSRVHHTNGATSLTWNVKFIYYSCVIAALHTLSPPTQVPANHSVQVAVHDGLGITSKDKRVFFEFNRDGGLPDMNSFLRERIPELFVYFAREYPWILTIDRSTWEDGGYSWP